MNQILNKIRNVDPHNSDAIKDVLQPFFQHLSKHTEVECVRWLRALKNVIDRFPKYCMSQRVMIENYLINFLESTNYYIVTEAAKCIHSLQQVRPSQEKTATAKSSWRDLITTLCQAAHSLIGALFPQAVDIHQQSDDIKNDTQSCSPLITAILQLSSVTAKSQTNNLNNKQTLFSTRLRNVFVFLQATLVEIYPVAKPIRPETILDVIVRALSLSSSNNQNLSDVAMVKTQALRTLDALVICLGPNLIPFSPLIFRFVMQTLKWTSENSGENSCKVRCAAYSSLSRWLGTLQAAGPRDRARGWQDELADHVLGDVTPHAHVVRLTMSNQSTKHLSKKAKRKLANTMLQESVMAAHMPGEKNKIPVSKELNDDVAIAALECAETFLTVCGIFLKPTIHKRFQERLVRECFAAAGQSAARALALLRALEACRKAAPPAVPPPTQYCLHLYSLMVNSNDRKISDFCSRALLDVRMHLHCSPQSLNFAVEIQTDAQDKEEQKNKVSERNRAALEALLGVNKMPKQGDEVITISDEPSNKKRRIDDIDKISVSSESVNSVESTDDLEEDSVVEDEDIVIEDIADDRTPDIELNIDPIIEEPSEGVDVDLEKDADEIPEKVTLQNNIHTKATQLQQTDEQNISIDKVDCTEPENPTIFEAVTQPPVYVSHDDEEAAPLSMEVAYDYPSVGFEKVTALEKLEGDNIPSSNETDDIQITCGQVVHNSQDVDSDKRSGIESKCSEVKMNGITLPEKLQNGISSENNVNSNKDVTVEDMLADFVDEVNEDITSTVPT